MCILQGTTNLTELFAFSGPGPERINGRLAMIGFVAPLGAELLKGTDLFDQISQGGALWFLLTICSFYIQHHWCRCLEGRAQKKTQMG